MAYSECFLALGVILLVGSATIWLCKKTKAGVGADGQRARQQVNLIIKDLRGQVVSDRDQGNVGLPNRQCRAESGGPLSGEVLERGRDVIFFLLRRIAVCAVRRRPFGTSLDLNRDGRLVYRCDRS
jgi:hypothetical protein